MTLADDVEKHFKGRYYQRNDGTCKDTLIRIESYSRSKKGDNHYCFSGIVVDRIDGERCGGDLPQMEGLESYTEVPKSRIPFLHKVAKAKDSRKPKKRQQICLDDIHPGGI